jgi:hypothetical protein
MLTQFLGPPATTHGPSHQREHLYLGLYFAVEPRLYLWGDVLMHPAHQKPTPPQVSFAMRLYLVLIAGESPQVALWVPTGAFVTISEAGLGRGRFLALLFISLAHPTPSDSIAFHLCEFLFDCGSRPYFCRIVQIKYTRFSRRSRRLCPLSTSHSAIRVKTRFFKGKSPFSEVWLSCLLQLGCPATIKPERGHVGSHWSASTSWVTSLANFLDATPTIANFDIRDPDRPAHA